MKKKKRNNDFSLSFLDIMACGLGGVIIIFLLLDNRPNSEITETDTNNEILIEEIERLSNSNLELSTANQQLELNIANEKNKLSIIDKQNETLEKKIKDIGKTSKEINIEVSQLREKISKMPQEIIEDPISNDELFEENYIEGLTIVGKKICILLDSSSSMTDEKLLEIIKRKNLSDEEKKKGPKWKRSLDIVKWILVRAPEESNIAVIRFSETAKYIAKESFQTS